MVEQPVNQHFENHICFLKMLVCLSFIHLMQLLAQESSTEFAMKALDNMHQGGDKLRYVMRTDCSQNVGKFILP